MESSATNGNEKMVGASVRRKEDFRLIQGEGRYAGDILPRDVATMLVLRSPHAHARIRSIGSAAARDLPGVLAVVTGAEFNATCAEQLPIAGVREHMKAVSRWPMASDVARYEGEPVAVVVAESAYIARDALELIEVDYEPLPAVVDCERGLDSDAPLVHEDLGTNLCVTSSRTVGDPDAAFAGADGVLSLRGRRATPSSQRNGASCRYSQFRPGRGRGDPVAVHPGSSHGTQGHCRSAGHRREQNSRALPRRGRRLRGQNRHLPRNRHRCRNDHAPESAGALGWRTPGGIHLHHPRTRRGAIRRGGLPQRREAAGLAYPVLH